MKLMGKIPGNYHAGVNEWVVHSKAANTFITRLSSEATVRRCYVKKCS